MCASYPSLNNNTVCQFFFPVKMAFPEKVVSAAPNSCPQMLCLETTFALQFAADMLCTSLLVSNTEYYKGMYSRVKMQ